MKKYSTEMQQKAAGELKALPRGSALAAMMADYRVVRAQLAACG